jgi:hypothetical protein
VSIKEHSEKVRNGEGVPALADDEDESGLPCDVLVFCRLLCSWPTRKEMAIKIK